MNHEPTGETKTVGGVMLHQIRCIRAIEHLGVKVGDIGGWIEKESNLSGNAWLFDDAEVFGDAVVSGNAYISGSAKVYGNARVCGDAEVHDGAVVYGDAVVSGGAWDKPPLYIQGSAPYPLYMASEDDVAIGNKCVYSFSEWHKDWATLIKRHGLEEHAKEYALCFNLACEIYGKGEYKVDVYELFYD